ncbi:MAG TPA: maleylpyruvate isomerase family mycothiol-dependent enzyme [Acidimicrobiales bacterium]
MSDADTWAMIHAERSRVADMLDELSAEQWSADTLCKGWNVQMVAAHMMNAGEQTGPKFLGGLLANGMRFNVMMDRQAHASARLAPKEIIARIRARTTTTNKPPAAAMAMLGEVVVHGNDIRQPLGIADDSSTAAKVACLEMFKGSNLPVRAKKTIAGLHLNATDADWSFGTGPDVNGPLVALLSAMATRPLAPTLSGDGVATLRSRLAT